MNRPNREYKLKPLKRVPIDDDDDLSRDSDEAVPIKPTEVSLFVFLY